MRGYVNGRRLFSSLCLFSLEEAPRSGCAERVKEMI